MKVRFRRLCEFSLWEKKQSKSTQQTKRGEGAGTMRARLTIRFQSLTTVPKQADQKVGFANNQPNWNKPGGCHWFPEEEAMEWTHHSWRLKACLAQWLQRDCLHFTNAGTCSRWVNSYFWRKMALRREHTERIGEIVGHQLKVLLMKRKNTWITISDFHCVHGNSSQDNLNEPNQSTTPFESHWRSFMAREAKESGRETERINHCITSHSFWHFWLLCWRCCSASASPMSMTEGASITNSLTITTHRTSPTCVDVSICVCFHVFTVIFVGSIWSMWRLSTPSCSYGAAHAKPQKIKTVGNTRQ